jgi:hypothetical protein
MTMPKPTAMLSFLAALLLAGSPAQAQTGPEARAFAADALPKIRAAFPDSEIAQEPGEPLQINITRKGEAEPAVINLHRVFGFCSNAPQAECAEQLTRLIEVLAKASPAAEPEAASLRIIVRHAQYWNYVLGSMKDGVPLHRQIGEDI